VERQLQFWAPLPRPAKVYFCLVPLVAVAVLVVLYTRSPLPLILVPRILFWLALALLGHAGEFELTQISGTRVFVSAGFAVSVATIADLPPVAAMLVVAVGSLTWNELTRDVPLYAVIFNRATLALCAGLGAMVFDLATAQRAAGIGSLVISTLLASFAYFLLNLTFVSTATGLRLGRPLNHAWIFPFAQAPGLLINYLALALVGDLVLLTARQSGLLGLLLALIPLGTSYVSLSQLVKARAMQHALLDSLASSLDLRDQETGGHTERVAALALRLGRRLQVRGKAFDDLYAAALLHDIGKIATPDAILLKQAPLTPDEWSIMRQHPEVGARLVERHPSLRGAAHAVRHHQEWYDGSGYPAGLKGEDIPLGARIITVADSYLTMVDGRPYRPPRTPDGALEELRRCSGTQFDPAVVAVMTVAEWQAVAKDIPIGHAG